MVGRDDECCAKCPGVGSGRELELCRLDDELYDDCEREGCKGGGGGGVVGG